MPKHGTVVAYKATNMSNYIVCYYDDSIWHIYDRIGKDFDSIFTNKAELHHSYGNAIVEW